MLERNSSTPKMVGFSNLTLSSALRIVYNVQDKLQITYFTYSYSKSSNTSPNFNYNSTNTTQTPIMRVRYWVKKEMKSKERNLNVNIKNFSFKRKSSILDRRIEIRGQFFFFLNFYFQRIE